MNRDSVAYAYEDLQEDSSWIGDFINFKSVFKGVIPLSHERSLSQYAESLVALRGRYDNGNYLLDLSNLNDYEQNELIRLYIESIDREIEESIYGNDYSINSSFLCALLSLLKNSDRESKERLAETIRNNIIKYYEKNLQEALDIACDSYAHLIQNNEGYFISQDLEHGDFSWRKS